jgi:cytoskeletal protein CcmA (bactofilin family)
MLNLRRNDRFNETKLPLKPAIYEPPGAQAHAAASAAATPTARESPPVAPQPQADMPTLTASVDAAPKTEGAGSKLSIGVNIKLKGVEISDCDVMVIEGHAEATVHSHVMEIAKPGTLTGTAMIDVAEIHGEFSGELTARTRLVVHGTGRVSGIIRYGKLIVAEGGELNGDVKRLDPADTSAQPVRNAGAGATYAAGTSGDRPTR